MRRSVLPVFLSLFFMVLLGLGAAGCGDPSATVGPPVTLKVSPSPVSMNVGQVLQATASILDANNKVVSGQSVAFSTDSNPVFSTAPSGLMCAGAWDANFIHCTPGSVGTATLNAKSDPSNLTASVQVFVHYKADSIVVGEVSPVPVALACGVPPGPGSGCISQGATAPANTAKYTVIACSNDAAVCAPNAPPCQLPNNTLGAFGFAVGNSAVATVAADSTDPDTVTVATAKGPGQTEISASLSGTTSLPAPFTTCAPKSISIHVTSQPATTTTVSVAKGATASLTADVVDTNNIAMTGVPLGWTSSILAAATVSSGTVTGVAPGTSNITASCSPALCNSGTQQALYSNVVTATVTGTANTATVYATSSDPGTTTIVPINTSTNTAGTAINLPGGFSPPNSFVFSRTGTKAFLGSDSGLIVLDAVAGSTTGVTSVKGKVLAVAADASIVIVVDTTVPNTVYEYFVLGSFSTTYNIANAVAAAITDDTRRIFIATSGGTVYEIGSGVFNALVGSNPAADISLLASGAFAYAANPTTDVFSSCKNALVGSVGVNSSLIEAAAKPVPSPNNTNLQMIAVTGNQITQIDAVPGALGSPCPDIPTNTAQAHSFPGVPAFTPVQLFVAPDSSKAVVTASDVAQLLVYTIGNDAASGSASTIPLSAGATGAYTGGVTLDSSKVWVGVAGINQVQGFTLSSGAAAGQVGLTFSPKLVAVRYQ